MTYKELKKIAQPHIREGAELPSNSFLLLNQLHIPFKNEVQCKEDYKGKLSPLYNTPAFLAIKGSEKTIYFNGNTSYWNFYIFHEIAHFLLGHEDDCPQNEMDADMLACILAAPIENLPNTVKTARDLSCLCKIPIDKAERYWNEIKFSTKTHIPLWKFTIPIVAVLFVSIFCILKYPTINTSNIATNFPLSENVITAQPTQPSNLSATETVYVTSAGKKYHIEGCRYIKNKTNLTEFSVETIDTSKYTPCSVCIKQEIK